MIQSQYVYTAIVLLHSFNALLLLSQTMRSLIGTSHLFSPPHLFPSLSSSCRWVSHLSVGLGDGGRRLLHRLLQVLDGLQQHVPLLVELLHLLPQHRAANLILLLSEGGRGEAERSGAERSGGSGRGEGGQGGAGEREKRWGRGERGRGDTGLDRINLRAGDQIYLTTLMTSYVNTVGRFWVCFLIWFTDVSASQTWDSRFTSTSFYTKTPTNVSLLSINLFNQCFVYKITQTVKIVNACFTFSQ